MFEPWPTFPRPDCLSVSPTLFRAARRCCRRWYCSCCRSCAASMECRWCWTLVATVAVAVDADADAAENVVVGVDIVVRIVAHHECNQHEMIKSCELVPPFWAPRIVLEKFGVRICRSTSWQCYPKMLAHGWQQQRLRMLSILSY